jgi:hypothetical protein
MTENRKRHSYYFYEMFHGGPVTPKPGGIIYAGKDDFKGFDELRFHRGKPIPDWPGGITFYVKGHRQDDYIVVGLHWMVVSERVRQVFTEYKLEGIQLLPLRIVHHETGEEMGPYYALNVFKGVDALDFEHTRWAHPERDHRRDEYASLDIIIATLRREALKGLDIFCLIINGKGVPGVYISKKLKTFMEKAGVTSGFSFIPIVSY